jgi:hypothetical protein
MEEEKGGIAVRTFIQDLYSTPLETALKEVFNDTTDVKQLWVDNLRGRLAPADSLIKK